MCLVLLSMMKTTILYTVYQYNRSFFIEMFCVNKDRPQLQCDGKCKLAQMQQEENEKRANDKLKQLQLEVVYFSPVRPVTLINNSVPLPAAECKLPSYYDLPYSFIFISRPVKPPQYQG